MQSRKEKQEKGWMDYLQIKKEADKEGSGANGATPERQRTQKVQGICSWLRQMHGRVLTFAHQASSEKGGREMEGETGETDRLRVGGEKKGAVALNSLCTGFRGALLQKSICVRGEFPLRLQHFLNTHTHTH